MAKKTEKTKAPFVSVESVSETVVNEGGVIRYQVKKKVTDYYRDRGEYLYFSKEEREELECKDISEAPDFAVLLKKIRQLRKV